MKLSKPKYIFVTGGVASSLGKGIISASIARLLQARGYSVTIQKLDPYINVDPGTLNPYEHGECYVTEDGAETDLDLGHYERFTNQPTSKANNVTTGKIYKSVIEKERKGEYLYDGISISALKDRDLSILRANNIGFVFQNYSLIKHLRVWENIELPLLYAKKSFTAKQRHEIITGLLKSVGLESKENDYPINLSGGEQQRVAIARALAVSPEAILCDEPTGALDKKTGTQIMELLHSVVKENGIMLLLVTHDPDIADTCDTIFEMDGGRITCAKNDT